MDDQTYLNDDVIPQDKKGMSTGVKIAIGFFCFLILLAICVSLYYYTKEEKTKAKTTKATTKAKTTKAKTTKATTKTFKGEKFDKIIFNYSKSWTKGGGNSVSLVTTIKNKSLLKVGEGVKGVFKTTLENSKNYIEVLKPIGYNKNRRLYVEYDEDDSIVSLHVTDVGGNTTGTINESCEEWIKENPWTYMYYKNSYPSMYTDGSQYMFVKDDTLFVYTTL